MAFVRAKRKRAWLKLAVTGPSGSGKTYSSLQMAFGLGRKVAMIDTENGSGSLYAHLGEYDVLEISAPFTVAKYIDAINNAVEAGYDVLVIDSITHAWAGEGGLLSVKESLDARVGNTFGNWAIITKLHEEFKAAILQSPIHVIATMRSKEEYAQTPDASGKTSVKKLGMAPIQRDGMAYEFTVIFDVAQNHEALASKDRTGLFDGMIEKLSARHGQRIREWLESGAEPTPEPEAEPEPDASGNGAAASDTRPIQPETRRALEGTAARKGLNHAHVHNAAQKMFGLSSTKDLLEWQAQAMIDKLAGRPNVTTKEN